jgi:hypothetical protein
MPRSTPIPSNQSSGTKYFAGAIRATRCVNQAALMRPSWVSALTPSSRPISLVILPL